MTIDASELSRWDAVETLERIARKDVTAREVADAAIARAQGAGALNAIVTPTFDRARETAAGATGPLAGVPFFIKDLVRVEGIRTAWGTASSGEYIAKTTDPVAKVFQKIGLTSLGKTATPEFGLTGTTEPLAFGPTHNPWRHGYSPGGSSGGAAALVASGVVPLAHGSDGGGSIRIPAACCGLVGLKATRGRFDMEGSNLLPVNVAVHGVLSRTVRDTVAFWKAVETVRRPGKGPAIGAAAQRPEKRVRIGWFNESPTGRPVDPEVRAAVEKTAEVLRSLGHEVKPVQCPTPMQVLNDFLSLWNYLGWLQPRTGWMMMGKRYEAAKLEPFTLGLAASFAARKWGSVSDMWRLRGWTAEFPRRVEALGVDVLLLPTLGELPPKHGHLATDVPIDQALERLFAFCPFTGMFNSAGAPALSLPLARSKDGLPIGVQLGTTRGRDALLLELGAELEAAMPWPQRPPKG